MNYRAEELDLVTALELSEYLVSETEWAPLDMFVDGMDYLDGMVADSLPEYDLLRVRKLPMSSLVGIGTDRVIRMYDAIINIIIYKQYGVSTCKPQRKVSELTMVLIVNGGNCFKVTVVCVTASHSDKSLDNHRWFHLYILRVDVHEESMEYHIQRPGLRTWTRPSKRPVYHVRQCIYRFIYIHLHGRGKHTL